MIEKILSFSLNYPRAILLFTVLIAIYGACSIITLPIDAVPDITNNQVQINVAIQGFSPTQMEKQVTYLVETSLAGIPGLQMTRSLSRNGFSQVTAIFDDQVDIYFARQQINERMNAIKEVLPQGASIRMGPISTGLGEISMWTVEFKPPSESNKSTLGWQRDGSYVTPEGQKLKTAHEKAAYLRTIQDWIIKPQLKSVKGLAEVDSIGGYVKQYHIEPNLERMLALGISFEDLISVIKKNNLSIGSGYVEKKGEAFLVKSDERLSDPDQIGLIVVTNLDSIPIKIRDIADVSIGKEMRTGSATHNGQEVVIGTALMLIGSNSRTVSQALEKKLEEILPSLPPDIAVTTVINRTKLVNATIRTATKNLLEGAFLVIAVLFVFLNNFKATLITALVIPLSMLMAAIGMMQMKISGNLMSLGAIDFGLIVDGAVIITENCLRRLAHRQAEKKTLTAIDRKKEVLIASREMIQPTVFGQSIIIIVYFPILALSGIEGKMFHPMALTVIFALISAFLLSLTFVPAMISLFVTGPFQEKENVIVSKIKAFYQPLLEGSLNHSSLAVSVSFVAITLSFLLFFQLGQEFVPTLDEQDIALHAMRIPSTSLTQSTEMQKEVETTLLTVPEVDYVFSKTGTAEVATDPMPPNVSDTFVLLKPRDQWKNPSLPKNELIAAIEKKLNELPGNNYEFTQPIQMRFNELISGVRSDLDVKVYGDDFSTMQKIAEAIANVLRNIPGAADVKVAQTSGLPILDVRVDREAISRLGLNVADVLDVVSIAMGGGNAGQLFEGDKRFDLVVKMDDRFRENPTNLNHLPIPLHKTNGKKEASHYLYIPLNEVATISEVEGLNEIRRENGKRFISIQSNVRGTDLGSFVNSAKEAIEQKVKIPTGYWLDWGGQFENLMSAKTKLMIVIPLCFVLIFILLFTALTSIRYASLVFTGVPLALTGGILSLWLTHTLFSISAAVGFIALSGIAVLNSLVLVTYINQLRAQGKPLDEAISLGALTRLRPVLMTALVASLGFIPMALATGTGAEVQKPLATVVIGGIVSSTLLTLLILPALYKIISKNLYIFKSLKKNI
ncbi:Cation efflux system protein CzcA [Chlamydiales bacterium STE3]|nr:Cation efflux system protein CzcA [Chlamydiales bacterium STE3]